ncbi:MAG TPA: hypothetical protein VJY41_11270 [Prolixibacteraceae bacterium]|nr:hypothetical protein [Prolixibacteraceae bacterium]
MTLNKKSYALKKMVQLIELGISGNATDFAEKLGMSRNQLFIEIEKFKSLDVEINFDRSIKSFVFTGNKRVIIHNRSLVPMVFGIRY